MKEILMTLLLVSIGGSLMAGCSGTRGTEPAVQPVKSQLRPAVPVTVDVSQLSNGDYTIYAKDGNRLNASVQEKAITGLRLSITTIVLSRFTPSSVYREMAGLTWPKILNGSHPSRMELSPWRPRLCPAIAASFRVGRIPGGSARQMAENQPYRRHR